MDKLTRNILGQTVFATLEKKQLQEEYWPSQKLVIKNKFAFKPQTGKMVFGFHPSL